MSDQASGSQSPLFGLIILVADDSSMTRILLNELLNFEGAKVHTVPDGLEALIACEENTFDVVLMDLQMPNLDGASATKALREKGFAFPIIGITAASKAEIDEIAHLGFNGFIQKPILATKLTNQINTLLQAA